MRAASFRIALLVTLSVPGICWAQASPSLRYFGYIAGPSSLGSYTNMSHIGPYYDESVVDRVNDLAAHGVQVTLGLSDVLFCDSGGPPAEQCPHGNAVTRHRLCQNYLARWDDWRARNGQVLDAQHVLAFLIQDEPGQYGIPAEDVDTAARLVKSTFPDIKTFVVEAWCNAAEFRNSAALDWVGLDV